MTRREADRKRDQPVAAADAQLWLNFLTLRREARLLLQSCDEHTATEATLAEWGRVAAQKYAGLMEEWNQRVDPNTCQPKISCPKEPPELFVGSLQAPERHLFEADYALWLEGKLWSRCAAGDAPQPASDAFRLWVVLPNSPVSVFVPEQLRIEEWHEARRALNAEAHALSQELSRSFNSLKHTIRFIGAKKGKHNEASAASAIEIMDQALALADRSSDQLNLLRELLRCAEQIVAVLWRSEYGSHLARELATRRFEQALRSGEVDPKSEHGQLQATLARLLDSAGIPVPQHVVYAAPTWERAFDAGQGLETLKSFLSVCWADARARIQGR
jgi:hypothetical protein